MSSWNIIDLVVVNLWKVQMSNIFKHSVLIAFMSYPASAFAYLDPGTGSIILQGLIAGLAAIAVSGKIFWSRIKGFLSKGSPDDVSETDSDGADEHSPVDD